MYDMVRRVMTMVGFAFLVCLVFGLTALGGAYALVKYLGLR